MECVLRLQKPFVTEMDTIRFSQKFGVLQVCFSNLYDNLEASALLVLYFYSSLFLHLKNKFASV